MESNNAWEQIGPCGVDAVVDVGAVDAPMGIFVVHLSGDGRAMPLYCPNEKVFGFSLASAPFWIPWNQFLRSLATMYKMTAGEQYNQSFS